MCFPKKWESQAKAFRNSALGAELDVPYGDNPREKYDLFYPKSTRVGTVVFVHGGYWMALDKSSWSHLSAGALAHGWAVAMPSYSLTPDVRIGDITRQIGAAIGHIHRRHGGPLRLVGHSAGGHLVSRMLCAGGALPAQVSDSIEHVVSISGLHDLRPLLKTSMNKTLGLDSDEAKAESPALLQSVPRPRLTTWVGGDERPEFIRQSEMMVNAWSGTQCVTAPDQHHFSVIEGLADPKSDLTKTLLG